MATILNFRLVATLIQRVSLWLKQRADAREAARRRRRLERECELCAKKIDRAFDSFSIELVIFITWQIGRSKEAWWTLSRYVPAGVLWDFAYYVAGGTPPDGRAWFQDIVLTAQQTGLRRE